MLGRFAQLLLVLTALAPVAVTYVFADYLRGGWQLSQIAVLGVAGALVLLAALIVYGAKRQLTRISFSASTLRTADAQVVAFLVTYLFPLLAAETDAFDLEVLGFVLVVIAVVVWTSHAYHFNPILAAMGFHFFEVTTPQGVEYLLLSRRDIQKNKAITHVVKLGHYIVLDVSEDESNG